MWILLIIGLFCLLLVIGAFTQIGSLRFAAKSSVLLAAGAFILFVGFVGYVLIKPMFDEPEPVAANCTDPRNPFCKTAAQTRSSPPTSPNLFNRPSSLNTQPIQPSTPPPVAKSNFELQAECKKEAQQAFYGDQYLKHDQWTFRSNWNVEEGKCFYSLFHHYMSTDGSVVSVTEMIREAPQNTSYGQLSGIGSSTNGVSISCSKGKGATKSCSTLEEWRDYTQELMDWSYSIQL